MGNDNTKYAYNRAPIFTRENYTYEKDCIYHTLLLIAIEDIPFITKSIVNGISVKMPQRIVMMKKLKRGLII